jgi:predicted nucleic acid-binding Zn finger protein
MGRRRLNMNPREEKAKALVKDVIDNGDGTYSIKDKDYIITKTDCTCIDHKVNKKVCKHMIAVRMYIESKQEKIVCTLDKLQVQKFITYMKGKGDVVQDYILYDEFGDFIDEMLKTGVIQHSGRKIILITE